MVSSVPIRDEVHSDDPPSNVHVECDEVLTVLNPPWRQWNMVVPIAGDLVRFIARQVAHAWHTAFTESHDPYFREADGIDHVWSGVHAITALLNLWARALTR